MIPAKNNIIVQIHSTTSPEYAILNPVSGSFDLMGQGEYQELELLSEGMQPSPELSAYLLERGYAYTDTAQQDKAVQQALHEFNREIENSQVQLMLVPTYGCNLACTYCFQHGIDGRPTLISREKVDAFFDYARANFSGLAQKPFITLFGGEPLVNSPAQREIINCIVDQCAAQNYELSAVTNGYDFTEFIDILKKVKVKEIQFTLDGSKAVHDTRRATANKKGTFDKIIAGIDAAVQNHMPVNLRSVVDLENIEDLVNLAEFLDQKGWLDLPAELFKTQIGRNYELFECYAKPQHLMTELELWGKISLLSKEYPVLSKLHRPHFKGIRHIVDTGEMYMASFDTCPACKTEWVFDLHGEIYGCTASCGREEYLLGTYWPEVNLNTNAINTWKRRNVKTIPECNGCKYDVICGGGCGVVAANKHGGNILSPDCRPIQGLMEIGVNHYIDEIKALSEDDSTQAAAPVTDSCCCGTDSCCTPPAQTDAPEQTAAADTATQSCCCSPSTSTASGSEGRKTQGCLICGEDLMYANAVSTEICSICGKSFDTYVKCSKGHYVCDHCHSLDILGKVEQFLCGSTEVNPVKLAQLVFELPGLNMHGPEYHSITPAVLIAAWQNLYGVKDSFKIQEAIKRGRDIKGGSCGLYGNCGAAVGAGIAVSILERVTPLSRSERSLANLSTGSALVDISKHGGPRCCKREAVTTIHSFMQVTDYFDQMEKAEYTCSQFGKNKDCIYGKCPFFPKKKAVGNDLVR